MIRKQRLKVRRMIRINSADRKYRGEMDYLDNVLNLQLNPYITKRYSSVIANEVEW